MKTNKDMVDEIRTAASEEAKRKRNKSQENVATEIVAEEETKQMSQRSNSSKISFKKSTQEEINDSEVDRAFFNYVPKKESKKEEIKS